MIIYRRRQGSEYGHTLPSPVLCQRVLSSCLSCLLYMSEAEGQELQLYDGASIGAQDWEMSSAAANHPESCSSIPHPSLLYGDGSPRGIKLCRDTTLPLWIWFGHISVLPRFYLPLPVLLTGPREMRKTGCSRQRYGAAPNKTDSRCSTKYSPKDCCCFYRDFSCSGPLACQDAHHPALYYHI